ncbi:MAG: phosphate ABC transporter permease subunit PstC [Anaerolineae bacterium]|nr:phosphate ABC transporter permease subunit PstC [Anaerolineae bacterium]MDW8172052.1 phosphate ABC transporter permease subunit PstC [Anaerolineae bacterium]
MTTNTPPPATSSSLADRFAAQQGRLDKRLNKRTRPFERFVGGFLFVCGALSIFITLGFTIVLGTESLNFFASVEWLNTTKTLTANISSEDTTLKVTSGGSRINVGDFVRLGIAQDAEVVLVEQVVDDETLIVKRGERNTEIAAHNERTTLFTAAIPDLVEFFTTTRWAPQVGNFGALPLITATFMTSLIAMTVAIPIGLGAAIYMSEYASAKARAVIKPVVEILAGVPTVVYGYFALTFVTPLLRSIFGTDVVQIYNMASAGLVVGILIIPTIASVSEDALSAVPRSLREASYGLGATRLETVSKVLLPAALSGISAAIILGVSRAVGETMIVLIAAGAGPNFTLNPFDNAETMAGHIARISTGDIARGSIDYNSVFAIGMTLFTVTLLLNLASSFITRRFREVYT